MNRAQCINTLKEGAAMSAIDAAIEEIRNEQQLWGRLNHPEEDAFTREILGTLIELQVRSVERAVRLGEAMNCRLRATNDDSFSPDNNPSGSALAVPAQQELAA